MQKLAWIAVVAALQTGATTVAEAPSPPPAGHHAHAECLGGREGYVFSGPTAIPDNNRAGITFGPLQVSRETISIRDLVLALSISHPYAGELAISLHYDADGDGSYEASSTVELYLARLDPCAAEALWACPIELSGTYFLKDDGWRAVGEIASFAAFDGLRGGGDFYLTIVDDAPGNTGIASGWSVHIDRERRVSSVDR